MLLTLMLFACGDKDDTTDDTGSSGDSGDSLLQDSDPVEISDCWLVDVAPLTLTVDVETEVTATVECDGDSPPEESALVDDEGNEWGLTLKGGEEYVGHVTLLRTGRAPVKFKAGADLSKKVNIAGNTGGDVDLTDPSHTALHTRGFEGVGMVWDGESLIALSEDGATLVQMDGAGALVKETTVTVELQAHTDHRGSATYSRRGFLSAVVDDGAITLAVADLDLGVGEADLTSLNRQCSAHEVHHVVQQREGRSATLVFSGTCGEIEGVFFTTTEGQKVYPVSGLTSQQIEDGEAFVAAGEAPDGQPLVELITTSEGEVVRQRHTVNGQAASSSLELPGVPTGLSIVQRDMDADEVLDTLLIVATDEGDRVFFAQGSEGRESSAPVEVDLGRPVRVQPWIWPVDQGFGFGVTTAEGALHYGHITVLKGSVSVDNPTFAAPAAVNVIEVAASMDSAPPVLLDGYVVRAPERSGCEGDDWTLATGEGGSLARVGCGYSYDGSSFADEDGHERFAVLGGVPLAAGPSGTTSALTSTVTPLYPSGDVFFDIMYAMVPGDEGSVQLGFASPSTLEIRDGSVEFINDAQVLFDHSGSGLRVVTLGMSAADIRDVRHEVEGEVVAPSALLTLPLDTDAGCGMGTWFAPGVAASVEHVLASAELIHEATDCADLVVPLVSTDVDGDGVAEVLMSDGTLLHGFSSGGRTGSWETEMVSMDLTGAWGGDLNEDGFGDFVVAHAEGYSVLYSDGRGGLLEREDHAGMTRSLPGAGPGVGQPVDVEGGLAPTWSVRVQP